MKQNILKNLRLRSKSVRALTILLLAMVNISVAQTTYYWQPTTGIANWNLAANWNTNPFPGGGASAIPTNIDKVVFNQGNSTCRLPNAGFPAVVTTTIAGMDMTSGFTGSIDLNSSISSANTLRVLVPVAGPFAGPTTLNPGTPGGISNSNVTGTGTLLIVSPNLPAFPVSVTGMTTGVRTTLSISVPDNITLSGNTFNGSLIINKTSIGTGNYTLGSLIPENNFPTPAPSITFRNSGTDEFIINNEPFNNPIIVDNTSTGKIRMDFITTTRNVNVRQANNGEIYLGSASGNFALQSAPNGATFTATTFNNGNIYLANFVQTGSTTPQTATFSVSSVVNLQAGTSFDSDVTFSAPSFKIASAEFKRNATITKTGAAPDSWGGGNKWGTNLTSPATATTTIIVNAGALQFPTINSDEFNHLTLTRNAGTFNPCYTRNCKVAGNLQVNGVVSFGDGTAASGALEFNGGIAQTVGSSISPLSLPYIVLNKSAVETVTINTNVQVTNSATMTNGLIALGANTITLNDPTSFTSYGNTSFVDGLVKYVTASGTVTFPTGYAPGVFYRPITISFSEALGNISARYFNTGTPSPGSVAVPITNVSTFEYWLVNANPSNNFNVTLPWKNVDSGNPNYVQDASRLRVSRLAGSWQDNGNAATTGTAAAGTITSSAINIGGANIGNLTLGSINSAANENELVSHIRSFKWRPFGPGPIYSWNNGANWDIGTVPTAADIALFDLGSTTATLIASPTVGGLELNGFTGDINTNGLSLNVNAISAPVLNTGNIIGGGTLAITGGGFAVSFSGTRTTSPAAVTVTSNNLITVSAGTFGGSFTSTSPTCINLTGGTFNGATTFTYTGNTTCTTSASSSTFGSNTITIRNSGATPGQFNFTNGAFSSSVLLDNTSTGTLKTDVFTNTFTPTSLTANNASTGTIRIDRSTNSGSMVINNNGVSPGQIQIDQPNTNSMIVSNNNTGTIWIDNATIGSGGATMINNSTGTFNVDRGTITGPLQVRQPNGGQMYLGPAVAASGNFALQPGATFTANTFNNGDLYLRNFKQLGATAQTASFFVTSIVHLQDGTVFNGDLSITAPSFEILNSTFNGTTTITKTGFGVDVWPGGNTYASNATIIATGTLRFPTANPDTFNGDLMLTQNGIMEVGYIKNCKVGGNLLLNGTAAGVYTFGNGAATSGEIEFIGGATQSITLGPSYTPPLRFTNIFLNKTGGQKVNLNVPIEIVKSVTFTNGIIGSSGSNYITFSQPSAASFTGGNNSSYVDNKVGGGILDFPTGGAGFYRPIRIFSIPENGLFPVVTYHRGVPPFNTSVAAPLQNISQCEYWEVRDATGFPSIPFNFTVNWLNAACGPNYVGDYTQLTVAHLYVTGTQWTDAAPVSPTGVNTNPSGTLQGSWTAPHKELGYLALASYNSVLNPLPIELTEFTGEFTSEGFVKLDWKTLSETNNDHFDIERADRELEFIKIGEVPGHGTTHMLNEYSWLDKNPLSGVSYYRLKQVDYDGQSTHSKIISERNQNENSTFSVYPNPAAANDALFFSRIDDVVVYDFNGKIVARARGVNELNLKGYNPGIYLVKARNGETQQFVVK